MNIGGYYWSATTYTDYPCDIIGDGILQITTNIPTTIPLTRKYSNKLITPLNNINGANQGYSDVTVTERGYNNELLNKTTFHYSNVADQGGFLRGQATILFSWIPVIVF